MERELTADGRWAPVQHAVLQGGIGDINSVKRGDGARFNAGKPPLELIPAQIIGAYLRRPGQARLILSAGDALTALGAWATRQSDDDEKLFDAMRFVRADWESCARVFDYGRRKYAAWNWAKGMPWSAPIGSAMRHLLKMARGEEVDDESGLLHTGHVMCNLVMLAWFVDHYPEGDDRMPAVES